jgi:hypothetical protein
MTAIAPFTEAAKFRNYNVDTPNGVRQLHPVKIRAALIPASEIALAP